MAAHEVHVHTPSQREIRELDLVDSTVLIAALMKRHGPVVIIRADPKDGLPLVMSTFYPNSNQPRDLLPPALRETAEFIRNVADGLCHHADELET